MRITTWLSLLNHRIWLHGIMNRPKPRARRISSRTLAFRPEQLEVRVLPAATISVTSGSTTLSDSGSYSFGTTPRGIAVTKTFTVTNSGNATLTLQPATLAGDASFVLLTNFTANQQLAPGASATLSVRANANTSGSFSAMLNIPNNDPSANPFNFTISDTVTPPQIAVSQNGTNLASGAWFNFGTTAGGTTITKTFTISNPSSGYLTVSPATTTGNYSISSNVASPSQAIAPGQTASITVVMNANLAGMQVGSLVIENSDPAVAPVKINLSGKVTPTQQEVDVAQGTWQIADDGAFDFGTTPGGTSVTKVFTVTNSGTSPLTVQPVSLSGPGNFTILTNFTANQQIAAGASATFSVRLNSGWMGLQTSTISFASNDSNESPFNYTITGTVTPPHVEVSSGGTAITDGGLFDMGTTAQGLLLSRTITVSNPSAAYLTVMPASVTGNFVILTNLGSPYQQIAPGGTATFSIQMIALTAGYQSGTVTFTTSDPDAPTFDFTVYGVGTSLLQEVDVTQGSTPIADGGAFDFGTTPGGTPVTKVFTVTNNGALPLTVQPVSLSGGGNFAIVTNFTANQQIAAGASATFSVRLNSGWMGLQTSTISFANNDLNENPFNYTITGTVTPPDIAVSLDGGDIPDGGSVSLGTTTYGTAIAKTFWVSNPTPAVLTVMPVSVTGNFSIFTNIASPWMQIPANGSAAFTILMPANTSGDFSGTVSFANSDPDESTFDFTVSGHVQGGEITVTQGATDVSDGGSFNFGLTNVGTPISKTFTVTNSHASQPLALQPITVPAGFTLTSPNFSPNQQLAPGASVTFTVQFDGTTSSSNGTLTFNTSDSDENPFNFTVSGLVNTAPTAVALNGAPSSLAENLSTSGGDVLVATIAITDDGFGTNNVTLTGADSNLFKIGVDGKLYLKQGAVLDRETNPVLDVTVNVDDPALGATPDATASLAISVSDVDEFDVTAISDDNPTANAVNENAANGTAVGITAFASDADATTNTITYSLDNNAGGRFSVNSATGVVTVANGSLLDRESASSYGITLRATSADGSFSTQAFTISVNDVDEFDVTSISDSNPASNAVNENAANGTAVGVTAFGSDADATTNAITYSLDNNAGGRFAINSATGLVTVANGALLDRESSGSHSITVRATSADGSFTTQAFTIAVNDVDEYDVTATSDSNPATNAVNENAANGTVVGITASASDADATTNAITYSLDSSAGGRFAINSITGIVTVANGALLDRESGASHDVIVRATSADGSTSTQTFTITVNDVNEFNVTTPVDANAAANAVSENVAIGTLVGITASANDADATTNGVTYSLSSNPGGLFAIDSSTGVVSVASAIDREVVGGSVDIEVRATSVDGSTSAQTFTITINDVTGPASIVVMEGSSILSSGATIDFGSQLVTGGAANRTFTIRNTGEGDLPVSSIAFLTGGTGFAILPGQALPYSVAPSQEFAFTVSFDPAPQGANTGTIRISQGEPLAPPFDFNVSGSGVNVQNVAGPEFRVNTYTTGDQHTFDASRSVALDDNGNFVVVWSSVNQEGSGSEVYAQRYGADGTAHGAEFRVNSTTTADQSTPTVAMDAVGNFVIAWSSSGQDGSGGGIYAQRYDAGGVVQGSEFQVNTTTAGDQLSPALAMNATGAFVVTWSSPDGSGNGIYAQRFASNGMAQGSEFLVNTTTVGEQFGSAAAMDADGNFLITWSSSGQDGSGWGVYAQRFSAAGVTQGSEFRVNSTTSDNQMDPNVAMDANGNFVISWSNLDQFNGWGWDVYARRYDATGVALGSEFRVNSTVAGDQTNSTVGMDATGGFVVTWSVAGVEVFARQFDAAGVAYGSEFQVNSTTANDQSSSTIGMDRSGRFVIVWTSLGQDGSGTGVYAQRYAALNVAPTALSLTGSTVAENATVGTLVGTLSTVDPNLSDTFNYTLVSGAGATGNASFQIVGNELRTNAVFDFETQSTYSVRIRTTDRGGLWFERIFTVSISDVIE